MDGPLSSREQVQKTCQVRKYKAKAMIENRKTNSGNKQHSELFNQLRKVSSQKVNPDTY